MTLATVLTRAQFGLEAPLVRVEVHCGAGLPQVSMVGLAETAVRESRDRVRAALAHCGFGFPPGRVTVNSAEAYIACCLAGLGMIQIPAYDVAEHLASGELVEVMPRHRAEPMPMTLLYPHRRHLSRRLQVFADWLVALLRTRLAA